MRLPKVKSIIGKLGAGARPTATRSLKSNRPVLHSKARTRIARHRFGSMSHKMKDHLYFMEHGYLFSTPRIHCRLNMKFYAAILMSADKKPFTVRLGDKEIRANIFIMRPGSRFTFIADDIKFVCAFIEPTHANFRCFKSVPATGLVLKRELFNRLNTRLRAAYEGKASSTQANELLDKSISIVCTQLPDQPAVDSRILKLLKIVSGDKAYSLGDLSKAVGLSYYRLSHLFVESLGISLRQFMQWKKVTVTASLLATRSVTEVAHEAGFTDSAHLSRTFQDIYGIPPSYLNDEKCVQRFYCQRR